MIPGVQVFVYPEELETTPPAELAAQVAALGCDAVSLAISYHRARRVLPRARRISVLTGTTLYLEPHRARYGRLVPPATAAAGLQRAVAEFRGACERAGLRFRAWVVALHHEALAAEHPEAAARTLDGAPLGHSLCPSAPEAVEYVAALAADVAAQLRPEAVELEAGLYPAWEPSYTLTLSLRPLSESARLLGSQCFCASCRALLGPAAGELEERARRAAGEPFADGEGEDDGVAAELASARATGVERLVRAVADAVHAEGSALRVFSGGAPEQAALQGLSARSVAAADRLLLGCGPLRGDELLGRFEALRALVDGRPATPSTNWSPGRDAAAYAEDAAALAAAGADGLALYNLSLVPEEALEAFAAAAAAFRATA